MELPKPNLTQETKLAKSLYGNLPNLHSMHSSELIQAHQIFLANGDVKYLNGGWYVTHSGLLQLAKRRNCAGIHSRPVLESSNPAASRWVFRAAVFKSPTCRGFIGYGDADPSNVSFLVHGAEMRVAETGPSIVPSARPTASASARSRKSVPSPNHRNPPENRRSSRPTSNGNGNHGGPKVRDRLCQIIRQHQLDPNLVKAYATDFCGVKALRDATREQVENFIKHLADWAEKDRNALLCQLNSYLGQKEGAA